MKKLFLAPLCLLVACSSPSDRAPVYDVKSEKGTQNARSGAYIASGNRLDAGQKEYVVQTGDTLYAIAWRAGLDVNVLIKRNNLDKPYLIRKGDVLKIHENSSKAVPYSQKKQKSSAASCIGQSCKKNKQTGVVKEISKEYPAKKVDEKATNKRLDNQQKESQKISNWRWPSKGKLTKTFASSSQGMKGISISNSLGTPVYAAAAGKVVYAGSGLRGYGNLIIIKHNYDYLSAYAHNDKLIIKENEQVKVGQKIAVMGSSGTDSVRLHFDIRYRGKSVDPLRYLPKR